MGQDPPDEPSGERPACAREEADGGPHADLVEVDGGRHVKFSLWLRLAKKQKSPAPAALSLPLTLPRTTPKISPLWTTPRVSLFASSTKASRNERCIMCNKSVNQHVLFS